MGVCDQFKFSCPICGRAFASTQSVFGHLRHHAVWERMGVQRFKRRDLLPGPFAKRSRGADHSQALVIVQPPPPLPPPQPTGTELEIVPALAGQWDITDLPLKKRILVALQARNQKEYVCIACGRAFESFRALGGHKAHHRMNEKKARSGSRGDKGPALVVYERRCECLRCGRVFESLQGLGGHKLHCNGRRRETAAKSGGGAVPYCFDLNESPEPEEEDQVLALPWYGCGAPRIDN